MDVGAGILFRILKAKRTEPLLEPRIEPVPPTGQQLVQRCISERLEMVRMSGGGSAQRVPDVRKIPVFETLESDVSHIVSFAGKSCAAPGRPVTRGALQLPVLFCSCSDYSVQLDAIIFTFSTFSRGASALSLLPAAGLADRSASVPLISTFSPT